MSRIGKKAIQVPDGVEVNVNGHEVSVKGPKGEMKTVVPNGLEITYENQELTIDCVKRNKQIRMMWGTIRSILSNNIIGVKDGYTKELLLEGVGFKAQLSGQTLTLALGYSHPINYEIPEGLTIQVNDSTHIVIQGYDKQVVGQAAAQIRSYYPVEPYKGKGVRYKDEQVRRKVGKAVA